MVIDLTPSFFHVLDFGGSSYPYKAAVGLGSLQLVHLVVLTFVECLLWAGLCSKPFTLYFLTYLIFSTYYEEQTTGVFSLHFTDE